MLDCRYYFSINVIVGLYVKRERQREESSVVHQPDREWNRAREMKEKKEKKRRYRSSLCTYVYSILTLCLSGTSLHSSFLARTRRSLGPFHRRARRQRCTRRRHHHQRYCTSSTVQLPNSRHRTNSSTDIFPQLHSISIEQKAFMSRPPAAVLCLTVR